VSAELAGRLVASWADAGTQLVFGVPGGGSNLDVVGAAEAAGLRFVLTHTETAAVVMAGVAAELSGAPGACVATRGPGAASALNGTAQAALDRQPVVVVTDCVTHADTERVSHQRLDHTALFGPVTKVSTRLGPHDHELAQQLVDLARRGRPGPVHVDVDATAPASRWRPGGPPPATAAGAAWDRIEAARRPVVVVGVGAVAAGPARRDAVAAELAALGARTGVPVLTTYKARGVVADSAPWAAGIATGGTIESPLLEQADLVVGVGFDPVELIPAPWPYEAPVVLLGGWPTDDSTYFGDRLAADVVGEVDVLVGELGRRLGPTSWPDGTGEAHRRRALDELAAARPDHADGLTPQQVVEEARRATPAGTIATVDAGAHMLPAVPMWSVEAPGELLISSGLATMGFALPAAVAASLVHPDRTVVCFTGDGGLGMVLGELETLARLRSRVVVVVFNDSSLSLIAIKQRPEGHGGPAAVDYRATDYAAVARGLGLAAEHVDDVDGYRAALAAAQGRDGPTLLDVRVDPSAYGALLDAVRGARTAARSAAA
jgi:acetolactate synthase-1/2/3 large subunit